MKRASTSELLSMNAYWVGLSFMWNSLHPIVLPAVLLNLVPETQKNTYLGILVFAGLGIAMVLQPLAGALSDGWASRWGRRRPLIVMGTLGDLVFLGLLAWSGSLAAVVIGYIGLQFTSNFAHGAMQGVLPDRVPREQLGAASALKNVVDMGGLVVASLGAGRLLDPQTRDPGPAMAAVVVVLLISLAITVLGTREEPSHAAPPAPLAERLRVDFRGHPAFAWVLAVRFVFLLGVYGIQSFAQYYLKDVLGVPNPAQQTGDLLAALTIALMACAFAAGWLSDRIGSRPVMALAGIVASAGMLLLMLARTPLELIVYGSVLGAGIGLFLTSNWTAANRLVPASEAAKYLGLTNLATAGAGALGRLEGPVIDALNNAHPGAFTGYTALFVFGALTTLASAVLLRWVRTE
jgi:MFS family permease